MARFDPPVVIGISGGVGTGTTTLADGLSDVFGYQVRTASKELRALYDLSDKSLPLPEFALKNGIDELMERNNRLFVEEHQAIGGILDARLALMALGYVPKVTTISILLTCDDMDVRVKRLAAGRNIPVDSARIEIEDRDRRDLERYPKIYPGCPKFNDPSLYQYHIDVSERNVQQVLARALDLLVGAPHT